MGAALEEKQKQERPWWRRKLQAEATKRSYGTDNYKGTTWGVAVGAQADQNYPIGGLICYYTVKGGISGGWALAVDEPQVNKAGNNQKAILCPEGQNKFCVRTEVLSLQNIECGWTEFYGDPGAHARRRLGVHLQEVRLDLQGRQDDGLLELP